MGIKNCRKAIVSGIAVLGVTSMATTVGAMPLPEWDGSLPGAGDPLTSQDYQDFTIYSLNYLTQLSEKNADAGDAFYLGGQKYDYATSPGRIHDDVVIITGNTGQSGNNLDTCGGTAASSGCDNAYSYPSPSAGYMTTTFTYPDPSVVVTGEPTRSTWTATQTAISNYLGEGDLTFLFNLNESNGGDENSLDGQSLLVSAKVDLTDAAGNVLISFYLGANNAIMLPLTAEQVWAVAGEPEADSTNLANPALGSETNEVYDPSMIVDTGTVDGFIATDPRWAFVHGRISVDKTTGVFLGMGSCAFTGFSNCETVNQNLGANEAAFAAVNLQLSDLIKAGSIMGTAIEFMNVDVFISGQSNGFEQLLIIATNVGRSVDEPGTLTIIALGLLALGARRRRTAAQSG